MQTVSTTDCIAGCTIGETLGVVTGTSVKRLGPGAGHAEERLDLARQDATRKMLKQAARQEADAIVAVRFLAYRLGMGVVSVMAYGTAVRHVPARSA